MNCESFKSWIWCLLFVGHLLVKGFQWKLFTWYHTNLVVSTKQELGFFLFHFLCLSSSSRGAFDQATCVTSDAETWQTETLSIRFENLTWGTEKWKQCHRPHGHTTLIERLLSPQTVSALSSSINYSAVNRKSLPVLWKTQIGSVDIEDVLFAGMLHRVNTGCL